MSEIFTLLLAALGSRGSAERTIGVAELTLAIALGGAVGDLVGQSRAFSRKLGAQVALCQAEIARNTYATRYALEHGHQPAPLTPPPRPYRPCRLRRRDDDRGRRNHRRSRNLHARARDAIQPNSSRN